MIDTSMYWDGHDLMTRNAMFNFVIGGRGTGKTYWTKRHCIKQFLKRKHEFIYLRRYKSELEDKDKFFSDVAWEFPDHEFRIEGQKGQIRKCGDDHEWKTMCYFIRLSTTVTKKSVPYPDVHTIIYDEFIIDRGHIHYLAQEVKQFLDFYNTVDRFSDRVKVLFLANSVSIVNPYFITFKLRPRKGNRFFSADNGYHLVEYIDSAKFKAHVDSTRFGRMIAGTNYYNYAVSNRFADDNDLFIAKKTPNSKFFFAIKFDSKVMGIWVDYNTGFYYVSAKYPKGDLIYTLTKADHEPNLLMLERSNAMIKGVRKMFMLGCVRFDSVTTREQFSIVLDYINLK